MMRPMRVLIVDDDALARLDVKRMLLCMEPEFVLVAEARDGRMALQYCKQEAVDIVITDMKMPGMDGLSLIEHVRYLPRVPAVLALSGFDEYELVRNAMRGGAVDYMLKLELDAQRLYERLNEIRRTIEKDAGAGHEALTVESSEAILYELTHFRSSDMRAMDQRLCRAGFTFKTGVAYCLMIKVHELYRFEDVDQEEYALLQYSLLSIIREELEKCSSSYVFSGRTGEFFAFVQVINPIMHVTDMIESICRRLIETVNAYLDLHCSIGIGSSQADANGLAKAAFQAKSAVSYRFYHREPVIWYERCRGVNASSDASDSGIQEISRRLLNELALASENGVSQAIEDMVSFVRKKRPSRATLAGNCIFLSVGINEFCAKYSISAQELMPKSRKTPQEFMSMETAERMINWLNALKIEMTAYIRNSSALEKGIFMGRVEEYIEAHYGREDMSLQTAAECFGLSPGYFSMLVKKHSGQTFSRKLTQRRIKEAKRLLRCSNKLVYEIADAVGIPDPFYFSRVFKRESGYSPADYRAEEDKC